MEKKQTLQGLIRTMPDASADEIIAAASAVGINWRNKNYIYKARWVVRNEGKTKGKPKAKPQGKAKPGPKPKVKPGPKPGPKASPNPDLDTALMRFAMQHGVLAFMDAHDRVVARLKKVVGEEL